MPCRIGAPSCRFSASTGGRRISLSAEPPLRADAPLGGEGLPTSGDPVAPGSGGGTGREWPERGVRGWIGVYVRGLAMGVAELVPGVSGGTIAFITGIYIELVRSIRRIGPELLPMVWAGRFRDVWSRANVGFLIVLWAGMGSSVLGLAAAVSWLLQNRELQVWGFFFGLIAASAVFVGRFAAPWTVRRALLALLGAGVGAGLGFLSAAAFPVHPVAIFFGGAIAICAWILPGVSGSFILLLLGQYPAVVQAIAERDFVLLGALAAGCTTGLLLFARVLVWLLRRHYGGTLALLCGFMGGALVKIWPWRVPLGDAIAVSETALGALPASPGRYEEVVGADPAVFGVLLATALGLAVVVGLDRLSRSGRSSGISPGELP